VLLAVACPAVTQCTAVDDQGNAVTFDPGSPDGARTTTIDSGGYLSSIACPSISQCTTVDGGGQEVTFNPASPGAPAIHMIFAGGFIAGVACPTTSQCTAAGDQGGEVTFNPNAPPSNPTPIAVDGSNQINAVACPTVTQCTAVDVNGNEATFNPTSPGGAVPSTIDGGNYFLGIDCPSAAQCTAVGGAGHEVTFNPSSPAGAAPVRIPRDNQLDAVACPSTSECVTVDLAGYGFAGFAPSAPPPPPPSSGGPAISATTRAATGLTTTSAVIHGLVDTKGAGLTWQFKFGKSRAYNGATPMQTIAAGHGLLAVSRKLTGLRPNTIYHFRLFATTTSGGKLITVSGADRTLRTKPTGKLVLASGRIKVVGRFAFIVLRCSSRLACRGQFSIHTRTRVGKRHKLRTVSCTATSFRLRPHQQNSVRARIPGACVALLSHARGHQISGQFTARLRTGQLGPARRVRLTL
jgi:hypothetical protein